MKTTEVVSDGRVIYDALKKELDGPLGVRVKELLRTSCAEDPRSKNFPNEIIEYIVTECIKGRRAEGVTVDLLPRLPNAGKNSIEEFTHTVMSRYHTALDRARAEKTGLNWYIWRTSRDGDVRASHKAMEGVIVNWNEPPSPEMLIGEQPTGRYHAGEADGCRCYAETIIDLKFNVKSPCKVHINGKIIKKTKTEFRKIYELASHKQPNGTNKKTVPSGKEWYKTWWGILIISFVLVFIFRLLEHKH